MRKLDCKGFRPTVHISLYSLRHCLKLNTDMTLLDLAYPTCTQTSNEEEKCLEFRHLGYSLLRLRVNSPANVLVSTTLTYCEQKLHSFIILPALAELIEALCRAVTVADQPQALMLLAHLAATQPQLETLPAPVLQVNYVMFCSCTTTCLTTTSPICRT